MNIPLAISKLTILHSVMEADTDHGFLEAIKLGIEALKFFKDLEDRGALPPDARLPGETTD